MNSPLLILASVTRSGSLLLAVGRNMRDFFQWKKQHHENTPENKGSLRESFKSWRIGLQQVYWKHCMELCYNIINSLRWGKTTKGIIHSEC